MRSGQGEVWARGGRREGRASEGEVLLRVGDGKARHVCHDSPLISERDSRDSCDSLITAANIYGR